MGLIAACVLVHTLLQTQHAPILEFPQSGVDDPVAYEGYATRFFRDSANNPFQIYLNSTDGRVVHVWADSANASAAFTVRDSAGSAVAAAWASPGAQAYAHGARRVMRYGLTANTDAVAIGWFLLGSMRQERDFQYAAWQRRPYADGPFILTEFSDLVDVVGGLPSDEQNRHLALLNADSFARLQSRLEPRLVLDSHDGNWIFSADQTTLDGKNHMTLELRGFLSETIATLEDGVLALRNASGSPIRFEVIVSTDHPALTPLDRGEIFNSPFEKFLEERRNRAGTDDVRRLERSIAGLELLATRDKLMAALPNYATYFGRDSMMAALMLEPISSAAFQEHVIGTVLRKVSAAGNVSHEEALGSQAIREHAAEYTARMRAGDDAHELLKDLQAVRENYRMIDDDFQLPVLVSRYLARADVSQERKREFLNTHYDALLRNLARVARLSKPYAQQPVATNLVGFEYRDDAGWMPGSWRDSRAGYANGRFAMDVNVVWVPQALRALAVISTELKSFGPQATDVLARLPGDSSALANYLRDPDALDDAIARWQGARRHFIVKTKSAETQQALTFLALALDETGQPIPVANTDVATDLFLNDFSDPEEVLQLLDVVLRPYPVGLLIAGVGPVVANDVYAGAAVQKNFAADLYHSPRVIWGREINLLLLGIARQIEVANDASWEPRHVVALRRALETVRAAVTASGMMHNELWSYRSEDDRYLPIRYGSSSDVQLWNLTDLAVAFTLDKLDGAANLDSPANHRTTPAQ